MPINRTCLHAFHIVATEGSYSQAAIAYHVSQPTLSAQVKELETRYKVKLFERRGRGVALTTTGQSLLEITETLYELEQKAENLLQSRQSRTYGVIRIGADSPFLIIPLMKSFQQTYPDVKLRIDFGNSKELLESLKSRKHDLILLPDIKASKDLFTLDLQTDRLIVFVNKDHAWAKADKHSIRLADLTNEKIVLREKGSSTRARFETILMQRKIELDNDNISIIGTREGVREAVAAGFGVGIVAMSEFGHDQRLHPLQIWDVKSKQIEYLVCLSKRKNETLVSAFFNSL